MELLHIREIGLSIQGIGGDGASRGRPAAEEGACDFKRCNALSPAYSDLLHTATWDTAGANLLREGWSPQWDVLLDCALGEHPEQPGVMNIPEEWFLGTQPSFKLPLVSMVATLKSLGKVAQLRLEKDGGEDFLKTHGGRFECLPDGGPLMSMLVSEGTSCENWRVHTALSVLCILLESMFHAIWDMLAVSGEARPALLRDYLLCPRLGEALPVGLGVCLKALFLPAGLNLRNLLLHGFLAPEDLPREFFSIVLVVFSSTLEHVTLQCSSSEAARAKLPAAPLQLQECIDDISQQWLCLDVDAATWLLDSTTFVPSTHRFLALQALTEIHAGRSLLGITMLLPVLEHSLRVEFCASNNAPQYGIAQHGAYYSTLDGFGQRNKHQLLLGSFVESNGQRNQLLAELGLGLVHILSDLFLQDAGPNIRACIVHGKITSFGQIYSQLPITRAMSAVLLAFLCLCNRRLPPFTEAPAAASAVLHSVEHFARTYQPVYHPDSILAKSFARGILAIDRFCDMLASRLPLLVDASDSRSRKLVQPGLGIHIKFECEASTLSDSKGSLRALAANVRAELSNLGMFASSTSPLASITSMLPERMVSCPEVDQCSVASQAGCIAASLSDLEWLKRLSKPDFGALAHSVPFHPLLLGLLATMTCLLISLADRLETLEQLIIDRKARTRQRRLYTSTLLTGSAFVEYLAAVMMVVEHHIVNTFDKDAGIPEEPLTRVANITQSLAGMGDDDDNRRGYDSGLIEIAGFLRTRAARVAVSATKMARHN